MLGHALSKVDYLVGVDVYMLPSKSNLNIGKQKKIQQQNSSKLHKNENWFKRGYKQGS